MSAMHKAARENAIEDMQNLIVSGKYDINEKDGMKRTPLHMAAWAGNAEIVKLLLRSKAKTDALANDNFTALHFANNVDIIKQLVKSNKTLIQARVSKGNKTALHIAVPKGDIEVVNCLIDLGSDVSAKTSTGQSCLELAKSDEMYNLIKEKLQSKIDKQQEILSKRATGNVDEESSSTRNIDKECSSGPAASREHGQTDSSTSTTQTIQEEIGGKGNIVSSEEKEHESENENHILSSEKEIQINNEPSNISTSDNKTDHIKEEKSSSGNSSTNISVNNSVNNSNIITNSNITNSNSIKSNGSNSNSDSLLGKKVALTALQRRKKKVRTQGSGSIILSHLEGEEEE